VRELAAEAPITRVDWVTIFPVVNMIGMGVNHMLHWNLITSAAVILTGLELGKPHG